MLDPHLDIGLGKARPDCAVVELAPLPAHDIRLPAIRRPDFQPGSRPIDQVQGRQADLGQVITGVVRFAFAYRPVRASPGSLT